MSSDALPNSGGEMLSIGRPSGRRKMAMWLGVTSGVPGLSRAILFWRLQRWVARFSGGLLDVDAVLVWT